MKKIICFLIIFVALISHASAYTFLNIYLEENGAASFLGETNEEITLPEGVRVVNGRIAGSTQELTSKQGETWSFSYFLEGAEINVILPEGSTVKNLQSGEISLQNNQISIFVEERINLTYVVGPASSGVNLGFVPALAILLAVLLILVVFLVNYGKRNKDKPEKKNDLEVIKQVLSEREKIIVDKLKETGKVKSSFLRKECDIPKASFSRHLQELEKKGIIKRTGEGKNRFVEIIES